MGKDYNVLGELTPKTVELHRAIFDKGYKQGFNDGNCNKEFYCNLNFEHGTHKGLDDVWELVRKLRHPSYEGTYSDDEKRDIFGYVSADSILTHLSASEAIQKVKEYEEKQKQADDEIKVGDEVGNAGEKYIITKILSHHYANVMVTDGGVAYIDPTRYKKTGRHFDQIAEVLEQLKEAQDEDNTSAG